MPYGIQQARKDFEDHRHPCRRACGIAVVQRQNVSTAKVAGESAEDHVGAAFAGVESASGPAYKLQTPTRQHRFEEHVAQPRRRTKEPRGFAGERTKGLLPMVHVDSDSARPERGEVARMTLAVVLDCVAATDDFAAEFRKAQCLLADA